MSCLISSQFLLSSEVVENYCAVLFVPLGMNSLFAINQPRAFLYVYYETIQIIVM